jgi:hypothetical protein
MSRGKIVACVAIASLLLAACGDDSDSSDTTAPNGSEVTLQQLSDALLTETDLGDDMGGTWMETQRDMFTTREPENPSIDPSLWCDEADGDALVALAGEEGADVELKFGDEASPFMVRQQAWSNGDVDSYFTAVREAVDVCDGTTWTDQEGNSYTMGPTQVPTIGDESVSWGITIDLVEADQPASITLQTVAKFGNVIMVLQGGASKEPDGSAPNYTLIARAAGDKVTGSL